jgi:uncharacterized protein (TIGR00252 family)
VSTEIGQKAEHAAAEYLQRLGYRILEQNWRTRWCEIDIVAEKSQVFYFAEVKYRGNSLQGNGLEYITSRKLAQMHFAAEFWMTKQRSSAEYRLAACEVTGPAFEVTAWLADLT